MCVAVCTFICITYISIDRYESCSNYNITN